MRLSRRPRHATADLFRQVMPSRRSAPRLPQSKVEIMGGRTPVDERHAEIPASLADTVIGAETAREIGLLRSTP